MFAAVALGAKEQPEFERHVEARQVVDRVQLGA